MDSPPLHGRLLLVKICATVAQQEENIMSKKKEKTPPETFGINCNAGDFVRTLRLLQMGPKRKDHDNGHTMLRVYAAMMTFMQESTGNLGEDPVMYASAEWFGGVDAMLGVKDVLQLRAFDVSTAHGPDEEVIGLHIGIQTVLKDARKREYI